MAQSLSHAICLAQFTPTLISTLYMCRCGSVKSSGLRHTAATTSRRGLCAANMVYARMRAACTCLLVTAIIHVMSEQWGHGGKAAESSGMEHSTNDIF